MQLLHNYPLDRVADGGIPFWSGAKKPPSSLPFDPSDPLHLEFIAATALMRCRMYGITSPEEGSIDGLSEISDIVSKINITDFRYDF